MIEIPVRNPNPISYRIKSQVLKPGEMWTEDLQSFGQKGTRDIILETSSLSNIGLQKRLSFLLTYPYGCLEQTVSAAFSQLYLDQWVKLTPYQEKLRQKHIQSAIQQINKFQFSIRSSSSSKYSFFGSSFFKDGIAAIKISIVTGSAAIQNIIATM